MKKSLWCVVGLWSLGSISGFSPAVAAEQDFAVFEKQFRELPLQARELTGPLFWLHGDESKQLLEKYIDKVAEGGNGSLTTESRPHDDWLGERWFRDVAICVEQARKRGLKVWIFDEKWWPSQGVAGKVPRQHAAKQLAAVGEDISGPKEYHVKGFEGPDFVAAVAGRMDGEGALDGDSLVDLAPFISAGELTWNAPAGAWKVMKFTHKLAPGLGQGGGRELSVDGMSKSSVNWFLQTVYQPHYDRFKSDFGKTVVGFFYDEPETRGDWGTELNEVLREHGVDWKKAYVAYKFRLAGEQQTAGRYQYLEARAETWGRTMYGLTTRWCEERGVQSIGHFMEHGNMYLLQDFCAGDMMRVQKYSSMGGIDAVFEQFVWGKRVARDAPCWQTPKLGSSITHAYGKSNDVSMVEIFGARGQTLTYPEMKWWTDHMHVSGVNFIIPHSFNPRAPYDTDCPPYFYNGGFEPRWPLYRVFADYTSRLSVMLTGGRHVAPVALLSPGQSLHSGKGATIDLLSEKLQDALYDCDWLPYEVFERDTHISSSSLKLRQESYKVLVVPSVDVIPHPTLARAKEFFDAGGIVIGYGVLPTQSATIGKSAADITKLREAIWGSEQGLTASRTNSAGGRSYFLPQKPTPEQLQSVLARDANIRPTFEVIEGTSDNWLHVLHRVKAGRDVFFVVNQNHTGDARKFRFRITAEGHPECWDAMRNEITTAPYERHQAAVEMSLTMEPNESVLIVFNPAKRTLPPRREGLLKHTRAIFPVNRIPFTPPPEPELDAAKAGPRSFAGCSWVWYPEGKPAENAPAATRWFRQTVDLPQVRRLRSAIFSGTADNAFTLYVNGQQVGRGDDSANGWMNPVALDVTGRLRPGPNVLAIEASNASTAQKVNPAGLIGQLVIEFTEGEPTIVRVDRTWKSSATNASGWAESGFNDSEWVPAMEVAGYGHGPWRSFANGKVTLSPAKANPFHGECNIPTTAALTSGRVWLEMEDLQPESAARIAVNGTYLGGLLGKPLRLDITQHVHNGMNKIVIEPFAPRAVRVVLE